MAWSLLASVSLIPAAAGLILAVFETVASIKPASRSAVTTNVAVPSLASDTVVTIAPLPLAAPQMDPKLAAHVQLLNVKPAGTLSLTGTPTTAIDALLLVTTIV
jgi:hypothetical protein